jgi:hypothetical protein
MVADFDILFSEICFILSHCDRSLDEVTFPGSQRSLDVENSLLPVSVWVVWACAKHDWVGKSAEFTVEPGN